MKYDNFNKVQQRLFALSFHPRIYNKKNGSLNTADSLYVTVFNG